MGMTNEERKKHIRIANMLIGVINDLERPMLMYQIEKDVAKEALKNYIKMLEQQPCDDCISRAEAINVVHKYFMDYLKLNDDICLDGIRSLPSVTPQSLEQIKWERDIAIEQLKQLGYSLGEKIKTDEDCISREYLIDKIGTVDGLEGVENSNLFAKYYMDIVKSAPSVTPKGVTVTDFADRCRECGKDIKQIYISKILDKIRAELIQSIQNGTLKIESGNEKLFRIIDKYKESEEV